MGSCIFSNDKLKDSASSSAIPHIDFLLLRDICSLPLGDFICSNVFLLSTFLLEGNYWKPTGHLQEGPKLSRTNP